MRMLMWICEIMSEPRPPADLLFIAEVIYMSMESHGGIILTVKTEELGESPVPVPLCPPEVQNGLIRARTRASAVKGRGLTAFQTSS
jgi:hypothetical protein